MSASDRYESAMRSLLLSCALLLAACSSLPKTSLPGDGSRLHVVVFWLKKDMPAAERAAMPAAAATMASAIDGLEVVWCGEPAGTPRDVVDNSFDLLLVTRFRDAAAAAAYDAHPVHVALVERFKPYFAKLVVYDGK